jgi:hypothetical protein
MSKTKMLLDGFLFECTLHYQDRGFPDSALIHLRWVLVTNTRDDQICLQTPYPSCHKHVKQLLGHFKPCTGAFDQTELASAEAVFGFAFGYQMKQWSGEVAPTDDSEVAANRIPGANNQKLAKQARKLHTSYNLDLYLQFEIADAIGSCIPVECPSKRKDQNTRQVLEEFVNHAAEKGKKFHAAVVVAHRHHYDRCRLLLEKQGIRAIRPPHLYSGYDPLEAQPRVMSPEECIVNDFASMAGMV